MALDYKSLRKLGGSEYGNNVVDPNATFEAGCIAAYDTTTGLTITCPGSSIAAAVPAGVFKWNKVSATKGVAVKETSTLTGVVTSNLKHANVSNVKVENAVTAAVYTNVTDYTLSTTNGTLTRPATGSAIASGETVLVTYTYQKTETDMQRDGKTFLNTTDDTQGSNRIVLLQGNWRIYTDKFDTSKTYTLLQQLYVSDDGTGIFTNVTTSNKKFGRIVVLPTASNPFMGIEGDFSVASN